MKAITTIYHGPTNTRGSRIFADDGDGNRSIIPVNNALSIEQNYAEAVKRLCSKTGWEGSLVGGHLKHGMVWVWETDEKLKV